MQYFWCGYIWVHHISDLLCFLHMHICSLLHIWEVFSHNFFRYTFDPLLFLFCFWDRYNVNVCVLDIVLDVL